MLSNDFKSFHTLAPRYPSGTPELWVLRVVMKAKFISALGIVHVSGLRTQDVHEMSHP